MNATLFNIQRFSIHDGPGIRTSFFFKGCNLRCAWCANPESQNPETEQAGGSLAGRVYTLDELLMLAKKDKPFYDESGGGVTLTGGEPMLQPDFITAFADALHNEGITAGIETAGHIDGETFLKVISHMDFAFIDMKHWNAKKHIEATGVDNVLIMKNIRCALQTNIPVAVRVPVIPGYNDNDAHGYGEAIKSMGGTPDVHILPFHQLGEEKYKTLGKSYDYAGVPQLHDEDLAGFAEILRSYGLNVQIGG